MKQEQVQQIINDYNQLIKLAETKFKFICELDSSEYSVGGGIKSITIDEKWVNVVVDDSFHGSSDVEYNQFHISFLWLENEEIEKIVLEEKQQRLLEAKQKKEEQERKNQEEKDKKDLQEFNRLKAKFEKQELLT